MGNRIDYLIECSRTAREELLFRVKHRDSWLKLQLYVQAILWALSYGIELKAASSTPFPLALTLSIPISFVFVCLYFVEDGLISELSKYIGSLSNIEMQINNCTQQIICWENSDQLKNYAKGATLKIRVFAQIGGFIILPGYLASLYLRGLKYNCWQLYFQSFLFLIIVGLIVYFIVKGFKQRKTTIVQDEHATPIPKYPPITDSHL